MSKKESIKGKPLKRLLKSLDGKFGPELRPVKREVGRKQGLFWKDVTYASHVSMGDFYELVTAGFYGGKLANRRYLEETNSREHPSYNGGEGSGLIKPDVIDAERGQNWEAKAVVAGNTCNLADAQIWRYMMMQRQDPSSKFYFALYRHNLRGVKSFDGTEEELFRALANQTLCSVVLPLSIVLQLYDWPAGTRNNLVYRYDGSRYTPCTCVRSHAINKFFFQSDELIGDLDLNLEDYEVVHLKSPKDFSVAGIRLSQFPIVWIKDRDYKSWIRGFLTGEKRLDEGDVPF